MFDRIKQWVMRIVDAAMALLTRTRQRFGMLDHAIKTFERYGQQQGNAFAAGLTYRSVLALVPVIMVAFAIAGFVLASRPDLIISMQDAIVRAVPGELGTQLASIISSAVGSRTTVGLLGLAAAAFTGIGWMSAMREALTQMWGGRVDRNPVLSKVHDLGTFALLGLTFLLTAVVTAIGNTRLLAHVLEWIGIPDGNVVSALVSLGATVVSVLAGTLLFTFVLSRVPLVNLPFRRGLGAGFVTALIFEALKIVGGLYFTKIVSSPAGVAFGPILGLMVLAYLMARILLYASAWCATSSQNEDFQVPAEEPLPPVVLSPVYDPSPSPKSALVGIGIGAIVGYLARGRRR